MKPNGTWITLPRSERLHVGRFTCDVWPFGMEARYSVLDENTGRYIAGGKCADTSWAKEVSSGFASSFLETLSTAKGD